MKLLIAVMIIALTLLLTGSAKAQSAGETGVKATIPFAFIVGEKALPAGEYVIKSPHGYIVEFIGHDAPNASLYATVLPADTSEGETGRLVFHRYGDTYILYEAVSPAMHMAVVLPQSRLEKRVGEGEARISSCSALVCSRIAIAHTAETVSLTLK